MGSVFETLLKGFKKLFSTFHVVFHDGRFRLPVCVLPARENPPLVVKDLIVFVGTLVLNDSYLVDPASSHMLVSKIKPCMSKYKLLYGETANGSLNQL
jgi:hypothetical protein